MRPLVGHTSIGDASLQGACGNQGTGRDPVELGAPFFGIVLLG